MTVRVRLRISGRVQGVWYRQSTADTAKQHGVAGWVRNLPDGDVEAVLEGEPAAVRAVVAWCRTGPPAARVADVRVADEPPEGLRGFRVTR